MYISEKQYYNNALVNQLQKYKFAKTGNLSSFTYSFWSTIAPVEVKLNPRRVKVYVRTYVDDVREE